LPSTISLVLYLIVELQGAGKTNLPASLEFCRKYADVPRGT